MKLLTIIVIIFSFFSCRNPKEKTQIQNDSEDNQTEIKNDRIEFVPEPDKEERLKWEKQQKEQLEIDKLNHSDSLNAVNNNQE